MFKDMNGDNRYKVGLHTHTTLSDGRVSPEEAAKIYKAAGYDALAITDHWKYYPEGELEGLLIISGCEYNMGASDTFLLSTFLRICIPKRPGNLFKLLRRHLRQIKQRPVHLHPFGKTTVSGKDVVRALS